jgi:glycosyltransferase 2 family protein
LFVSPRLALAIRIGGIALVAVLLWLFAHKIEWPVLWKAVRHAELWPLGLAVLLYFASLYGKAIAWRVLLAPQHVVPVRRLFRYTIGAYAASVLAPARAGEVVRVLALRQRDGVPAADSTGVAVTDKLLHAVTLLLLAAPLPWLLPRLPRWVGDSLLLCAIVAAAVLALSYFAIGRVDGDRPRSWFGRFLIGMHAVRDPRRLLAAIGVLVLVWLTDLLTLMACLYAVGIDLSLAGGLFILFTLNLAIAVPTTPANIGTMQVGALVATRLLGIPNEPALAFALLYHGVQIVPLLVVALGFEVRQMIPAGPRGKLAA